MIITYQGHDYHFDQRLIGVDEWRELKRKYGLTPKQFGDGLDEADPDAMTFLYWTMLRQNKLDKGIPLGDHLKPDLIELNNATAAAMVADAEAAVAAEAEQAAAAVPTQPSLSPGSSPPSPATPGPALTSPAAI